MSFIKNLFNFTVETTIDTIPQTQPIPICEEAQEKFNCNADWLSQVLGKSISSFNIKPVGGGFTTQSYRINYTSEGNVGETSVFVKYLIREKDESFMMRLIGLISNLNVEPLSRKEVFFYNHLQGIFNDHGIRTPRPVYVALEDNGDFPKLIALMGIQKHFRGLIMMEDLGQCQNFGAGTPIPEKYAILSAAKLGQLHALNWYKPIHPEFPVDYLPDAYVHFFNFHEPNFLNRNLDKDEMMERLNWWKNECPFLQEESIRDALMAYQPIQIFSKNIRPMRNSLLVLYSNIGHFCMVIFTVEIFFSKNHKTRNHRNHRNHPNHWNHLKTFPKLFLLIGNVMPMDILQPSSVISFKMSNTNQNEI
jgi:hypothetical protein